MTRRDDRVSLQQMLDHARETRDLVQSLVRADLDRERVLVLALVQLLQIIGKAGLEPWEVDRLLYNFTDYFIAKVQRAIPNSLDS